MRAAPLHVNACNDLILSICYSAKGFVVSKPATRATPANG